MNQNAPIEDRTAARARPAASVPPGGQAALSPEGRALLRSLMDGDTALARRKDLGELYRRLQALPSAAAPADPGFAQDRLDRLEGSLNRIDGALRIELAPILKAAVEEGLAARSPTTARRSKAWAVALFLAGCAIGIFAGPMIRENGPAILQETLQALSPVLPQNWGSANSGNQID